MNRAPNWSNEEFEQLLRSPLLTDAELAEQLPARREGAVSFVREGIHSWHTSGVDHQMLSQMMRDRLTASSQSIICARCKTTF